MSLICARNFPLLTRLRPFATFINWQRINLKGIATACSLESNPSANRSSELWPDFPSTTHKLFDQLGNRKQLEEFLPLLSSLLLNPDKLREAEQLFESLSIRFPREIPCKFTSVLGNLFIKGYLFHDAMQQAHEWYSRMCKFDFNGKPDVETFSILFNHLANRNETGLLRRYLHDFLFAHSRRISFSLHDLIQAGVLCKPDLIQQLADDILRGEHENAARRIQQSSWINQFLDKIPNSSSRNADPLLTPKCASMNIAAQQSKSNGLHYLKRALNVLNVSKGLPDDLNEEKGKKEEKVFSDFVNSNNFCLSRNPMDPYRLQELLESESLSSTLAKLNRERREYVTLTKSFDLRNIRHLLTNWTFQLAGLIDNKLATMSAENTEKRIKYTTINLLKRLSSEKIALIALLELFRCRAKRDDFIGTSKFVTIANAIGTSIERELLATMLPDAFSGKLKRYRDFLFRCLPKASVFQEEQREHLSEFARSVQSIYSAHLPDWTPANRVMVGAFCLELCVGNLLFAHLGQNIPLLKHEVIGADGNLQGIIQVHPHILEMVSKDATLLQADPASLPMLVPPQPWLTFDSGGYLSHKNTCVRLREDPTQLALLKSNDSQGLLGKVLLGLDILGSVSWTINEQIFQVMITAWNEELEIAGLPPKLHQHPTDSLLAFQTKTSSGQFEVYRKRDGTEVRMSKNDFQSIHSQRCDINYKLEIAKAYLGTTFYFPHNIDFRGRAYPIPAHFNHIGNDLCRGLLQFSEKKPLGPRGLEWLKIHLANLYGNSKVTLKERVKFCNDNMSNIRASAREPLAPSPENRWWTKADDPWQCLACCKELVAALDSPNPSEYLSGIPIHQDGSCNGPQHYAALGRDALGARQVNLAPMETPQDIYGTVAVLVEEEIARDLEGTDEKVREIATRLRGKVTRKIVKQPVMTNVYGVTGYGARRQIRERLQEFQTVDPEMVAEASAYLSKKVFHSLDKLFATARVLQNWLAFCAKEISLSVPPEMMPAIEQKFSTPPKVLASHPNQSVAGRASDKPNDPIPYPMTLVGWTNPVGFPAMQPYRKKSIQHLKTALQNVNLWIPSEKVPCDVHKQLAGFPPNFIHSLDASHMFMTAIECYKAGLTFASVHDSFWTHAGDVDKMSAILREQFIKLHKENIMNKLRQEFVQRYGKHCIPVLKDGKFLHWRPIYIPSLPEQGEFDIEQVRDSLYFFS